MRRSPHSHPGSVLQGSSPALRLEPQLCSWDPPEPAWHQWEKRMSSRDPPASGGCLGPLPDSVCTCKNWGRCFCHLQGREQGAQGLEWWRPGLSPSMAPSFSHSAGQPHPTRLRACAIRSTWEAAGPWPPSDPPCGPQIPASTCSPVGAMPRPAASWVCPPAWVPTQHLG